MTDARVNAGTSIKLLFILSGMGRDRKGGRVPDVAQALESYYCVIERASIKNAPCLYTRPHDLTDRGMTRVRSGAARPVMAHMVDVNVSSSNPSVDKHLRVREVMMFIQIGRTCLYIGLGLIAYMSTVDI